MPIRPGEGPRAARDRFTALHEQRFGFALDRGVEVVSARHVASGEARPVSLARRGASAWRDDHGVDDGGVLAATVSGRASIALSDATLLVERGWTARTLVVGGWLLERDAERGMRDAR